MGKRLSKEDRETRRLLKFIDRCAKEVAKWPAWMKGGAAAPKQEGR